MSSSGETDKAGKYDEDINTGTGTMHTPTPNKGE